MNTSGKHVSSSGCRIRREEERLNNPALRSCTAINVTPGGEQFPFWCKTKPGWMRSSDRRRTTALRAREWGDTWAERGREKGREKVERSEKQAQRAEGKNFYSFLSLAFCSVWGFCLFLNSQEEP